MINLAGRTIACVRPMTEYELSHEGWTVVVAPPHHGPPVALVLDDGSILYAAGDAEGNEPGCLFGVTSVGEPIRLATMGVPDNDE